VSIFKKNWSSDGFKSIKEETHRKKEGIEALNHFYRNNPYTKNYIDTIERPFKFQFSKHTLVNGRYDMVLTKEDKFEIGDFKTSTIDNQKQADTRIKKSRQMMLYALAFYKEYKKLPERLFLDFIGSDYHAEFKPTKKTIEKISKDIEKAETGIRKQNFKANPNKFNCSYCAYKSICPYKQKGS
jgi:CRISPR/Cas system-associated exonuclease Cas4 (RecB family)